MNEKPLYLEHPKTLERCAVMPEHYADKYAQGYRLDPTVGGQEAPKQHKAAEDAHKPATAKSEG